MPESGAAIGAVGILSPPRHLPLLLIYSGAVGEPGDYPFQGTPKAGTALGTASESEDSIR